MLTGNIHNKIFNTKNKKNYVFYFCRYINIHKHLSVMFFFIYILCSITVYKAMRCKSIGYAENCGRYIYCFDNFVENDCAYISMHNINDTNSM